MHKSICISRLPLTWLSLSLAIANVLEMQRLSLTSKKLRSQKKKAPGASAPPLGHDGAALDGAEDVEEFLEFVMEAFFGERGRGGNRRVISIAIGNFVSS